MTQHIEAPAGSGMRIESSIKGLSMKSSFVVLTAIPAALLLTSDAQAYVDPGTGSYFLQILIAGILGTAFAVKLYWRKIKDFLTGTVFGRNRTEEEQQTGEDGKG
jgi:hypothetical protein